MGMTNGATSTALVDLSDPNDAHEIASADVVSAEIMSAEVHQQISTARRFPRSATRFRKTLNDLVTLDPEIASQCMYALKRSGKLIEGPSIRFAELVAACWGNNRVGARVVATLDRFIVAQGFAWDLETNSAIAMEAQRRITDKNGDRYNDDMVGVTGNAASSIALRNAVLRLVPKALWWDVYLRAKAVAAGDVKTLAARRNTALQAFRPFGVTDAQVFATLGVDGIADITTEHLVTLSGFLNSITQEDRDPEDIFVAAETKQKPPPAATKTEGAGAPAGGGKPTPSTAAPRAAGASASAPSATKGDEPGELEDSIAGMLPDAKTPGDVDDIARMFEENIAAVDEAQRQRINTMLLDTKARLAG